MKKIAIGMPVYNGENFLSAAIESILAQTCGDFDLVISDNASTDDTEEICQAYVRKDSRIRYIRQSTNVGAANNYNVLFRMSDSRYFKWAAHDDVLAPGFLEACVRVLDRDGSVVLASPASALIDEADLPLHYSAERGGMIDRSGVCWPALEERNNGLTADDPIVRFAAVLLNMFMCVEIFGLMRRSALLRTSLHAPFCGSDKVLLAEMSLLGRFWLGQDTLFFRRCHAQQFTASTSGSYRATWFSGRRRDSVPVHQVKLLLAYFRSLYIVQLTTQQRYDCLHSMFNRVVARGHNWRRLIRGM